MDFSKSKILYAVILVLRIVLGAIFVYAGYVKLRDPWQLFAAGIASYEILPMWAVKITARALPWFEVSIGLLLMAGRWFRMSTVSVSALLQQFLHSPIASARPAEKPLRKMRCRRIFLQLTAELQARRAGHVDVQDDHARARTPKLVSRGLRALRLGNLDVRDLEGRAEQGAQSGIVVDKQDPQDARPPFPVPVEECRQPNHVT